MISDLAGLIDLVPLPAIPAVLLALFFIAAELGFRYHRRFGGEGGAEDESQVLSNDIGTAWLRAGLVAAPHGPALQNALADYARIRVTSPLPHETEKLARAAALRNRVWAITATAQATLDGPRATNLVSAVNAVLDTGTQREKAVAARVPGEVMLLLVIFACVACFLLGYMLDAHGHQHRFASGILFLLMGLTIMLILDLDRPADGAILVDQSAMEALVASLAPAGG